MSTRVDTSESAARPVTDKPLSPVLIGDMLRILDLVVIGLVGLIGYLLYVYPGHAQISSQYLVTMGIGAMAAAVMFQWFGVYAGEFVFARLLRADRMVMALAVTFALLVTAAFALKISTFYSRVWMTAWFAGSIVLLGTLRLGLARWVRSSAEHGQFANRTVIVGTGEQAHRLAEYLHRSDDARTQLLGLIDDRPETASSPQNQLDTLGDTEHLIEMIRENAVDRVLIGLPWQEEARIEALVHRLATTPVHIHLAPDLAGYHFVGRGLTQVGRLPMVNILSRPISGWDRVWKGLEDRVLAVLFLVALALPMTIIAPAIRLDSPGPILFKQRRHGFNNNLIEVWKFRTMYDHLKDPNAQELTTKDDDRVTRIGRFLRRTSLDELPQLFNVLKGDMSVVGPRPHATEAKADGRLYFDVVDSYAARHRVKPGITGWAQVNGWRGETDTEEKIHKRVEHDLYYIDNWSIWLDLLILGKTLAVVVKGEKAY